MNPESAERWSRAKQLFAAVLRKAPSSRADFLAEVCGDDRELRTEVETLLAAHDRAGSFLESAATAKHADVADAENQRLVAGARIGPYDIIALLGVGGMGEVYRARDTRLSREVAIKILPAGVHAEVGLRRFEQEARAAGSLNHPNILAVHDIGSHEDAPYIVSELLHGETLRERLAGKALPLSIGIDLAVQLALGLSAAHDKGVIHRDLKPENLFITEDGRLKILDFGIAKLVHEEEAPKGKPVTQTGTILGTIGYMSPEQVRGEHADHRSDIFAFGAIVSEMLSGKLAFDRPTPVETGNAILNDEPRELPQNVPIELDRIVRRCLEKNPQRRFQSAHDLAFQLATVSATATGPRPASLIVELKRRRVFRALVGYGIAAFAVLQIVEPVMHGLHWPDAVLSYVVVALAAGFPIVVTLAWIFDINRGSVERTSPASSASLRGARLAALLIGIGVVAAAPGVLYYFVLRGPHGRLNGEPRSATRAIDIAVLPLASLSDQDNAYLAEAIHDELLRKLTEVGGLSVISRTSVLQYKAGTRNLREIGEALGVSSIVEGSVQRIGNRVRVQARLIDARTDREVWAQRYDRELTDVFAIEAAVAEEIAGALKERLSPVERAAIERRPTEDAEAYDLYLRGLAYEDRTAPKEGRLRLTTGVELAESYYRRAIERDPSFALARAHLAELLLGQYWYRAGTPQSVVEEAARQAHEAVRLRPDLPESHLALGFYHYWGRRDFDSALREFEIARSGDPNHALWWSAAVKRRQGHFDENIRDLEQLARLDPQSEGTPHQLAVSFTWVRRYEDAERALQRALTLAPDSDLDLALRTFMHELWKGDTRLAKAFLRDAPRRLAVWSRLEGETNHSLVLDEFGIWLVNVMLHNPREALLVLDSLPAESFTTMRAVYPKSFLYAEIHSALGETALARQEYQAARPTLEAQAEAYPANARQRSLLALTYASLGQREAALREARRAADLLPVSKDAIAGSDPLIAMAIVEARTGDRRAAIERIRHLLTIPCALSPALLRIDPSWAPLRGDPEFQQLAGLAPR